MGLDEKLTALLAWRKQYLPGCRNPDVLRPGVGAMRGTVIVRLRPCTS